MYGKWVFIIGVYFLSLIALPANACGSTDNNPIEIYLEMRVDNLLTFDIDGFLCGETLYLPAAQFLSLLNISHTFSANQSQLEADFPAGSKSLRFNFLSLEVESIDGVIQFDQTDVLFPHTSTEVFISKELLEKIFLFRIQFNYSNLLVSIFSEYELPVIADHKRRIRYNQFNSAQLSFSPDVEYAASRSMLNGWVIDWNLNSSHSIYRNSISYGATTGGQILGGDLFFSSRGTASDGIIKESLRGQWHYPIYSTPVLSQIIIGDQRHQNIFGDGYLQFQGVEITNSPNAPRQYFDDFELSAPIKEGWDIEMYTNNRLTGLVRGDEKTNHYLFSEPLRYGPTQFTLRHYSPNGFSHEDIYYWTVPRTLLPPGAFEYALSAGNYRFYSNEFINAQANMGISSFLTLGGGFQLSNQDISRLKQTPYLTTTFQVAKSLVLEARHTFSNISEVSLHYFSSKGMSVSTRGRRHYSSSRFNRFKRTFEGSINTSFPLQVGLFKLSAFINTRATFYPQYQDYNINAGITTVLPFDYLFHLRSIQMYRNFQEDVFLRFRSDISLTVTKRILRKLLIRPGISYDHHAGMISGYDFEASSRISRNGDFSLSVHHNPLINQYRVQFSFRYTFPFGRYQSHGRSASSGNPSFNQMVSGSLVIDTRKRDLHAFNTNQTRKAFLRLEPYILIGIDSSEALNEAADQFKATLYVDGYEQATNMDGDIITNLIPYQIYHVHIEADNLDNPLWQLKTEHFQIQVIPHVMNRLPIPVIAVGEVSGRVQSSGNDLGISFDNLSVEIKEVGGVRSKIVRTYANGRFYYVGLLPGNYTLNLDPDELFARNLTNVQQEVFFTIEPTLYGDIVDKVLLTVELMTSPNNMEH